MPATLPRPGATLLSRPAGTFLLLSLGALLAWLFLLLVAAAASRNLMFDGAMNLEIARSIALGDGPRRMYDTADLFPPGVQSKEPYVLLGALVFELFGVGAFQAQLPNLVYLALLCWVVVATLRRLLDPQTALAAGILLLAMPSMAQYGLNGYGEIPTLFFGLAALASVAWPTRLSDGLVRRCLVAGMLAGLALATKVVGIVQVAVVAFVLGCRLLVELRREPRAVLRGVAAFSAGVLAPLLLVECWRWAWLGQENYLQWWRFQLDGIAAQAGATPRQPQAGRLAKVAHHFAILGREMQVGPWHAAALITLPLASCALVLATAGRRVTASARWWLLGLATTVALYLPWWLAVVPTEKAWLRYIYIAMACLALLAATGLVANTRTALDRSRAVGLRVAHGLLALGILAAHLPFLERALRQPLEFSPNAELRRTLAAARIVSELPDEALVFGYGWYAAPTVQLHADRGFIDLTDWPIGTHGNAPAFLVADRASLATGILAPVLARYPHRALLPANGFAQVYALDFANPVDPFGFRQRARALPRVEFTDDAYPGTIGFQPYDPIGGRWAGSDSEVLLRHAGEPGIELSAYMALPRFYRFGGPLTGRVVVDGCDPMPIAFAGTGWRTFRLTLPCSPPHGSVRVRILLDDVFDLPTVYTSQRAMLVRSIGFVGVGYGTETTRPLSHE